MASRWTTRISWLPLGIALASGWISGCSGDDPTAGQPSAPPDELTSEPLPSSPSSPSSGSSSATSPIASCIAACEAKHPKGAVLGRAIDSCWANHCDACNTMAEGGALSGPAHGSCKEDVKTPSAACSQCTVESCCAEWDACFGDADCTALNACSVACYH